jgi:mono/diheme cytochrome c family protein
MTTPNRLVHLDGRLGLASAIILVFAIVVLWTPPSQAKKRTDPSPYAVLAEAPDKARVRSNPFESDPDARTAGRKLFEQHCVECHGQRGGGSMHGANLVREEVRQASPGTLFWVLTNGVVRRGMPVWSKLPEPQRWQLVAYLRSLNQENLKP